VVCGIGLHIFQRAVVVGVEPRADIKWVATGVRSEEFRCDNHACGLRPPYEMQQRTQEKST